MKAIIAVSLGLVLAGCVSKSCYVPHPSYAYTTERGCKRHEPLSKFDPNCDRPVKGYKGFKQRIPCPL